MNERIDHAAEARERVDKASEQRVVDEAKIQAMIAQAHATLALVEQQRMANIIALHRHEVKYDVGSWSRLYVIEPNGDARLKTEIRDGLGLT